MARSSLACLALLAVMAPALPARPQAKVELVGASPGVREAGEIYEVDRLTGRATRPRAVGIPYLMGIAFSPQGRLYGLTTFASQPPNALVEIDPDTGSFTTVGATGLTQLFEGDLAFDPTSGRLYGIQNANPNRSLFRIDVGTGAATIVGDVAPGEPADLSALAFDPSGALYAIDTTREEVVRLDPRTARILSRVRLSVALGDTAGLAWHPEEERFYVADGHTHGTNALYTLDLQTGGLALVGPLGLPDGLSGLAFRPR